MFERLKRLYNAGRLNDESLRAAVEPNAWITPEQYEEITGKPYNDPESEETGEQLLDNDCGVLCRLIGRAFAAESANDAGTGTIQSHR